MAKLLRVLGFLFARGAGSSLSLQEISREVGLPQSTVHRILQLCVLYGMVVQDREQRYTVGSALLAVGLGAAEDWGLATAAQDSLARLAQEVREEAYLTMRIGFAGVFVARSASPRPIRVIEPLFKHLPLHCGASRKLLLAHAGDQFLEKYLEQGELTRFTENTITDPGDLRAELNKIRADGYAISRGERSPEICGVAAGVVGPHGHVLASVSVLAPADSLGESRMAEMIERVQLATTRISEGLQLPDLRPATTRSNEEPHDFPVEDIIEKGHRQP